MIPARYITASAILRPELPIYDPPGQVSDSSAKEIKNFLISSDLG